MKYDVRPQAGECGSLGAISTRAGRLDSFVVEAARFAGKMPFPAPSVDPDLRIVSSEPVVKSSMAGSLNSPSGIREGFCKVGEGRDVDVGVDLLTSK